MKNTRRVMATVLTVLVLFAVISSLFAVAYESHHDCTGENCRICAMIAVCRSTLKSFADAFIAASAVFACLCAAFAAVLFARLSKSNNTPTSLKVKLLN